MKALLLAAGRGTRISRHIDGKPKCTVRLDETTTLIEYSVDLLKRKGIRDVTVALGYRGDIIRKVLTGRDVKFVENPFYDVTNSIASLWFARQELKGTDSFIVMNGDVFLSDRAMDIVLAEERSPVMFFDVTKIEEADYKFHCEGDLLVKYGKDLSVEETTGEYVGCATFANGFLDTFETRLDELIRAQKHSMWWEDVLYSMASEFPIITKDIGGAFWAEVDFIEDYERIQTFYKSTNEIARRRATAALDREASAALVNVL